MADSSYKEFVDVLKSAEDDVVKGYGGNRAAATRARKALLAARDQLNECRRELLACGKGPDKDGGTDPRAVTAQFASEDSDEV